MARGARRCCEGDVYHVVLRGVGRQVIFEDDCDRARFMELLARCCRDRGVVIVAWCLMSNHAHLLLLGPIEDISLVMHRFETSYACHFNNRHERVGSLFQGRFTSVPVEDEGQLCATVRYIHRNPVEIGGELENAWSSFREHIRPSSRSYSDGTLVTSLFADIDSYVSFHNANDSGPVARESRARMTDDEVLVYAREILGGVSPHELKALERPRRDALLAQLRKAGLSVRQIERATSIGRSIVSRAKCDK